LVGPTLGTDYAYLDKRWQLIMLDGQTLETGYACLDEYYF